MGVMAQYTFVKNSVIMILYTICTALTLRCFELALGLPTNQHIISRNNKKSATIK